MAATLQEMQESRDGLYAQLQGLQDRADRENRELTHEEQVEFDSFKHDIEVLDKQIVNKEALEALKPQRTPAPPLHKPQYLPSGVNVNNVAAAVANRYHHQSLKAYKGKDGVETAYRAGQFFLATLYGSGEAKRWCHDHGIPLSTQMLAQGESVNTAGAVLVPGEFEQTIINLREEYGVFRQNTTVVPMSSDTKQVPRRTGGLTYYFGGENPSSAMTQSDMTFDSVQLVAKKVYTLTLYSNEIGEDAIVDLGDLLTNEIALAFATAEDQCGFNGDGTSTYGGMTGLINALAAGSIYTAITGNTAFSTLDLDDFTAMSGKLPQYARRGAKWYIHAAGYAASMERLITAAGGNTIANLEEGASRLRFLGYPVVITQVMNSTLTAQTSTSGLVYFGDLMMSSKLGSRRGVTVDKSTERYFDTDQIGIRGTQRFHIVNHETGTASAAGAMIMLKTPGS